MLKRTTLLGAVLALSACATSHESRIRSNLIDAGVSPPVARCMAERMADRLSDSQLRSLAKLSGQKAHQLGAMRVDEFLRSSRHLLDAEVYAVVARAGLGCAIAG